MNKIKSFFSNIFKNIGFGIKVSYEASKVFFSIKCVILLSTTVIPIISMWLWKEVLNNLVYFTQHRQQVGGKKSIVFTLGVYLLLKLSTQLIEHFDKYVNVRYSDELTFYIEKVMIDKTSRMDLAFFDSASMGDKIRHARSNFNIMTDMTWLVFNIISEVINILIIFIIISRYNVFIGILTIIVLIPFMLYNKRHVEKRLQMEKEQIRDSRKRDYFANAFFDNNIQFEIKLNDIGEYFIKKYNELWKKLYIINKRYDISYNIKNTFILLINISSELLVLVISVLDVMSKKIGIGDLQYNLNMVSRLRNEVTNLINDINNFLVNNTRLNELQEFMKLQPEFEKSGTRIPSKNPKIEFCNVSFRYPNSEQYVLKDCSFTIEPHEKIGLIGLNGSGKSTIIKLIVRFYDPEEGCIKLDGVDLKEYDVYKVRKVFGILFQDYVTYCLPFRDIVALSNIDESNNDKKLDKACDISGVSNIIKNWENGYDTILGRYYADNGKDLSGGQWQLVGLARAYFKDSEYMILDEPSASLDPISEDRIFEQIYRLSKDKSSITISHRLSNTTLADKIFVIENGKVIERGSHKELLQANGKYAYLFKLQAERYTK